ncbi:MAG: hypothetical protein Q4F65_12565 [Propionibacteriaceae bacterium]|nr:hypothetical protein [Propionibacteriaceae bacterium]
MTADFTPVTAEHELVTKARGASKSARALEVHYAADTLTECADRLAWLYGRAPDNDRGTHWTTRGSIIAPFPGSEPVVFTTIRHGEYTPEQAVDLARALLTAAEEARRG